MPCVEQCLAFLDQRIPEVHTIFKYMLCTEMCRCEVSIDRNAECEEDKSCLETMLRFRCRYESFDIEKINRDVDEEILREIELLSQ